MPPESEFIPESRLRELSAVHTGKQSRSHARAKAHTLTRSIDDLLSHHPHPLLAFVHCLCAILRAPCRPIRTHIRVDRNGLADELPQVRREG